MGRSNMKHLVTIILLLGSTAMAHATACVDKVFKHDHINLYLCQNYSNYDETTSLLFKARTQRLNSFIKDLINQGKLENKKFEIQLWDGNLTFNHIMVSQNSKGYHVSLSGYASFKQLAEIINYFTQADWTSYVYDPDKVKDRDRVRENFEVKISEYTLPNLEQYTSTKLILWQIDSISMTYVNDSLFYFDSDLRLRYTPSSNFPVKIHDRYLFFQANGIFVYHDKKEMLQLRIDSKGINEPYSITDVYAKWVNIGYLPDKYIYSYSYEKNRFYKLNQTD
jgi:hypothetical protein